MRGKARERERECFRKGRRVWSRHVRAHWGGGGENRRELKGGGGLCLRGGRRKDVLGRGKMLGGVMYVSACCVLVL